MNHTPYSRKISAWIFEKTGCTLQDLCRKFNYPTRETKIMGLDETDERKSKIIIARDNELKSLYLESAKDKKMMSIKGVNRSFTEYFKTLISGWILEDLTIAMLRQQGMEIEHNGADVKRVITLGNAVSQDADLNVKVGDCTRLVELTNEFNSVLNDKGFIEKRCPSLPKLYKEKGIWLYRDIIRGKYVLIDFATENVVLHLRHHDTFLSNWEKDVNRYVLSENGKKERDDRMLAAELIAIVGCSIEGKEQPTLREIEDMDSPPRVFAPGGVFRNKVSMDVVEVKKNDTQKTSSIKEKTEKGVEPNQQEVVMAEAQPEGQDEIPYEAIDFGDDFV